MNIQLKLRLSGEIDRVFAQKNYPEPFAFNREVANAFDDMVLRSIPFYEETIRILCEWISKCYVDHTKIYDLGCSTGTTIAAILDRFDRESMEVVAIDKSEPMLDVARKKLGEIQHNAKLDWQCEDIVDVQVSNASVVIMNYTLQFVSVERRSKVLRNIFNGLNDDGIFFISEKIVSEDPRVQEVNTSVYEDFKARNGYSKSEILKKKAALEKVLVPYSLRMHQQNLYDAGFRVVEPVFLWNNFCSIVAIK